MRIYYDTEFVDDGRTIGLISIGMVAEDGKELYRINGSGNHMLAAVNHKWLKANVVPSLPVTMKHRSGLDTGREKLAELMCAATVPEWDKQHPDYQYVMSGEDLRKDVYRFITQYDDPELWAYYSAYDHVVLAQLWGPMVLLPGNIPMYTNDLMQEWNRLGRPQLPKQSAGKHNALADARHNRIIGDQLRAVENEKRTVEVNMAGSTVMGDDDMNKLVSSISCNLTCGTLPKGGVHIKQDQFLKAAGYIEDNQPAEWQYRASGDASARGPWRDITEGRRQTWLGALQADIEFRRKPKETSD